MNSTAALATILGAVSAIHVVPTSADAQPSASGGAVFTGRFCARPGRVRPRTAGSSPGEPRLPGGPRLPARAEPEIEAPEPLIRVIPEVVTDFPALVGAELTVEGPFRLMLGGAIGGVPTPYLRVTSELIINVGGLSGPRPTWSPKHSRGAGSGDCSWDGDPIRDTASTFGLGTPRINLSGTLTDAEAVAEVTGLPLAAAAGGEARLESTLHTLDSQLGYRWHVGDVTVRVALGFIATVGASATIEVESPLNPNLTADLVRLGEAYLEDVYRSYVFTPTLGLGVGYDFSFGTALE